MSLKDSIQKVLDGERLTPDEGYELYTQAELPLLGMLAGEVRSRFHTDGIVTYIIDRNINPTNVCVTDCGFCAFYRRPGDPESYVLAREEIYAKIDELQEQGGIQVLMQGGHHPTLKTEWFAELFRDLKQRYPDLWLHAMSPPEIVHLSHLDKKSVREVLQELKDAGMDSIPGGGAEILVERVREIIAPKKATTDEWLDVMRQASAVGMRGSATMMFGSVDSARERIEHLDLLRDLQDETVQDETAQDKTERSDGRGFFTSFIPWTFQPDHTPMAEEWAKHNQKVTRAEYLRTLAISRIYLDNFVNVQTSWVTQGIKTCQVGLSMGANDVGSMMLEENVVSSAGCDNMTTIADVERHIKDAGFIPMRRKMNFDLLTLENQPTTRAQLAAEGVISTEALNTEAH
jgi:cyclic dehypoxanthinyl futalosine synthase